MVKEIKKSRLAKRLILGKDETPRLKLIKSLIYPPVELTRCKIPGANMVDETILVRGRLTGGGELS